MKIFVIGFLIVLCAFMCSALEETTTQKANFTRSRYSRYRHRTTTVTPISNDSTILSETASPAIISIKRRKTTSVPTTIQTTDIVTSSSTTSTTPPSTTLPSTTSPSITTTTTTTTTTTLPTTTEQPITETKYECGHRIGENVPWIAILEHSNPTSKSKKKSLSKGVFIDSQHVITTVSSIHNSNPFWVVSGVRLGDLPTWGENSTVKGSKGDVVRVGVAGVYLHKKKDLAIIKLDRKINSTDFINPICLPESDNYNYRELYQHMCQLKRASSYSTTKTIEMVSVQPLSPQDCTTFFHRQRASFSAEEFCAWDETGDNCTGDLGGPLMALHDGKYHLIGLNSFVNSDHSIRAEGLPGVYTRVGSHLKWIEKVLKH